MPITYEDCDGKTCQLIKTVMTKYHLKLAGAGVTITALFACDIDKDGAIKPAVKVHGHTAAAKIAVTSLQDRARGVADAKLTIETSSWQNMAESRRIALIDHELEYLELKIDDDGIVFDDRNRPKLKIKIHDYHFEYFHSVAQRHGEASVE
jgi:hypothetical protein